MCNPRTALWQAMNQAQLMNSARQRVLSGALRFLVCSLSERLWDFLPGWLLITHALLFFSPVPETIMTVRRASSRSRLLAARAPPTVAPVRCSARVRVVSRVTWSREDRCFMHMRYIWRVSLLNVNQNAICIRQEWTFSSSFSISLLHIKRKIQSKPHSNRISS